MDNFQKSKIKAEHLCRTAYLYVRQSTMKQVLEHTESTKRQYALKEKIIAAGWDSSQVVTIDEDLGCSGATTSGRTGFKRLVSEVGIGNVGMVSGIEVSRLARSSADWTRLLEICALTKTLIMDEDGVYDINDFNDRLLLGLKGTMSEAELHYLKSRMRGGLLNKANRGELRIPLPIGFLYDEEGNVIKDPDQQVQLSINMFFKIFKRTGSGCATIREFNRLGYKFPKKDGLGFKNGALTWIQLMHGKALQTLHNPRYAGVYYYGKTRVFNTVHGKKHQEMPREKWHVFLPEAHPSYITMEEFEANQKTMADYCFRKEDRPPREGPSLLQGIVICGKCGEKMTINYHTYGDKIMPRYICEERNKEYSKKICQSIKAEGIDNKISKLLLMTVTPLAMEISLAVQEELLKRKKEIENMYLQNVERARYEADLAQRRYMMVDPDNRLVAWSLESTWNSKLQELRSAEDAYKTECGREKEKIDQKSKKDIMAIATNFEGIWNNPNVPDREKKRIVRLLIEDVTLLQGPKEISINIVFKGGETHQTSVNRPLKAWEIWATAPEVIKEIDRLLDTKTASEIAEILNEKGFVSGKGQPFSKSKINGLISQYKLNTRYERLRKKGLLTAIEAAEQLNVPINRIKELKNENRIKHYRYSDKNDYLYELTENNQKLSV